MSNYVVLGLSRKNGTFVNKEGVSYPYDNYEVSVGKPFSEGRGFGLLCKTMKVKADRLPAVVQKNPNELVGKEVKFNFDEYKNVDELEIL